MHEQVDIPGFLHVHIGSAMSVTLASSVHPTSAFPETPDESPNAPAMEKANVIGPRGVHRFTRLLLAVSWNKVGHHILNS